jgi:hypothetical protein
MTKIKTRLYAYMLPTWQEICTYAESEYKNFWTFPHVPTETSVEMHFTVNEAIKNWDIFFCVNFLGQFTSRSGNISVSYFVLTWTDQIGSTV